MIIIDELRFARNELTAISELIFKAFDKYSHIQLSGVVRPNLGKEFSDLGSEINQFYLAIDRLLKKSEENVDE